MHARAAYVRACARACVRACVRWRLRQDSGDGGQGLTADSDVAGHWWFWCSIAESGVAVDSGITVEQPQQCWRHGGNTWQAPGTESDKPGLELLLWVETRGMMAHKNSN